MDTSSKQRVWKTKKFREAGSRKVRGSLGVWKVMEEVEESRKLKSQER
jgi:hypothetical protein